MFTDYQPVVRPPRECFGKRIGTLHRYWAGGLRIPLFTRWTSASWVIFTLLGHRINYVTRADAVTFFRWIKATNRIADALNKAQKNNVRGLRCLVGKHIYREVRDAEGVLEASTHF